MSCGLSYQLMDEWTCVFCFLQSNSAIRTRVGVGLNPSGGSGPGSHRSAVRLRSPRAHIRIAARRLAERLLRNNRNSTFLPLLAHTGTFHAHTFLQHSLVSICSP